MRRVARAGFEAWWLQNDCPAAMLDGDGPAHYFKSAQSKEFFGKTLVEQRLGRSGTRWSRPGDQRILAIRTLIECNRWDRVSHCHCELALAA